MKKQTFKNCLKLGILLYLISLLVVSCSNETTEIQLTEIQKIEKEFSFKNFNDDSVKNNLVINWNDFILKQDIDTISNDKVYEFNTSSKINTSIDNGKQKLAVKYKLLVSKNDSEQWDFELIKFLSNNSESIDNISYFNPTSFSGTLYHYNLNGENIKIKAYKNGELLSEFPDKEKDVISAQARVPCVGGDTGGGGFWMFTRTKHYTDWYTGSNTTSWTYTHSVHNYTTSEYVWVSTGGGGGSSNGDYHAHRGEHEADNHPVEVIIDDDKIDDSNLKPCMKTILTKLKSLTKGISHIVVKFSGNIPNYNWVVKDGSLTGQTGSTDPPAYYNKTTGSIITTFDSQAWLSATDLSWARTMLHESIHANLAIDFAINRPNFIANYPTMVTEWGKLQNWNDVHHEEIARSIVNDVAIALEQYGKIQGYNLTKQFYEDMAWGGLQDTSTFKSLPSIDQKRILNTISIELTGLDTNGNSNTQKGKNAGC